MGVVAETRASRTAMAASAQRRGVSPRIAIALAGGTAAIAAGVFAASSDVFVKPEEFGVQIALLVGCSVAAALLWANRPPGNRITLALLAHAAAVCGVALQGAGDELVHTIGVTFDPIVFIVAYAAVFAFPAGRLNGRAERLILAGFAVYLLVRYVPYFAFSQVVAGASPFSGCNAPCSANAFMIADRPDLVAPLGIAMTWAVIALFTATTACLVYRLASASRPRRRTLLPVYLPALVLTIPLLVFHGFAAGVVELDAQTVSDVGSGVSLARVLLAFGFLLAIAQASFFAKGALERLVVELGTLPDARRLREIVADALDDPSAELAFNVDDSDEFVTSDGERIARIDPGGGRAFSPVERRGQTVAVIWHDAALSTDPELIRAASQALVLALDNGRLATELHTTNAELAASRARVVAVADAGRRELERDLHDGAQQQLIALRIKVELARELAETDADIAARLADVGYGLDDVLAELRDLAHGSSPPLLRNRGLAVALASVVQRVTPPAALAAETVGRHPIDVEAAVYFCCLEGLQNVSKHAGAYARARVHVSDSDEALRFEITDDGVGFDVRSRGDVGMGLTNMRDRVGALGGTLSIDSVVGGGTRVCGRIPSVARVLA